MADTPKSLSDVKALLEEAVQVVKDLEATASNDQPTTDPAQAPVADSSQSEQDNPTPPTA